MDEDIEDVLHLLDEFIGSAACKESEALSVVDAWYSAFNAGDGEAMYGLLDAESPILFELNASFSLPRLPRHTREIYAPRGG